MAKKQATAKTEVKETAAAATVRRTAKPSSPRVKVAQHSKTVTAEPVVAIESLVAEVPMARPAENSHDAIAKIAYSLWESRGGQGGSEVEDWLLAEQQYQSR